MYFSGSFRLEAITLRYFHTIYRRRSLCDEHGLRCRLNTIVGSYVRNPVTSLVGLCRGALNQHILCIATIAQKGELDKTSCTITGAVDLSERCPWACGSRLPAACFPQVQPHLHNEAYKQVCDGCRGRLTRAAPITLKSLL